MMDSLAVQGCQLLTDACIADMAAQCSLSTLNLAYCNFTDGASVELGEMSSLRSLDVSFCPNLTDQTLEALEAPSHRLRLLRAWGSHFSEASVAKLFQRLPELEVEHGHSASQSWAADRAGSEDDEAGLDVLPRLSLTKSPSLSPLSPGTKGDELPDAS